MEKPTENIVGKVGNTGNEHFLFSTLSDTHFNLFCRLQMPMEKPPENNIGKAGNTGKQHFLFSTLSDTHFNLFCRLQMSTEMTPENVVGKAGNTGNRSISSFLTFHRHMSTYFVVCKCFQFGTVSADCRQVP